MRAHVHAYVCMLYIGNLVCVTVIGCNVTAGVSIPTHLSEEKLQRRGQLGLSGCHTPKMLHHGHSKVPQLPQLNVLLQ